MLEFHVPAGYDPQDAREAYHAAATLAKALNDFGISAHCHPVLMQDIARTFRVRDVAFCDAETGARLACALRALVMSAKQWRDEPASESKIGA